MNVFSGAMLNTNLSTDDLVKIMEASTDAKIKMIESVGEGAKGLTGPELDRYLCTMIPAMMRCVFIF